MVSKRDKYFNNEDTTSLEVIQETSNPESRAIPPVMQHSNLSLVFEGDSELEGAELNKNGDRNVFQEQVQRHRLHEDTTELGITIRKYENEGTESRKLMPFDSIIGEGLAITENPNGETNQVS